jgi:hypothetical protein
VSSHYGYDKTWPAARRGCRGDLSEGKILPNHPVDPVTARGLSVDDGLTSDVGQDGAVQGRAHSLAGLGRFGLGALPWLLAFVVGTVVLHQSGTPALDIARYSAYWCLGVTLPGLLVARATVGTRGNWPEDVAMGAVTGLGLELLCFALWAILGRQQQLWLWALLVVAIFVAVPRLRRHWRIESPQPLPPLWSWGVASAIATSVLIVRPYAFGAQLPPGGGYYDKDVVWHLSIVHELTRSFPPQVPQMAGELLRYHWFSHVHMAAASLVSGAPEATVVLRLWLIPLLAVTALIGARLAMELSGTWWSGPVAAWALIVFTGTTLLQVPGESAVIFPTSPSEVYLLPVVLGATVLIVRALRGSRLRVGWAVLALLLVAAAGAKPSAMPLVLAGTCLAALSLLVQRRRQWLSALSVVAMIAVILPVSLLAVAGSDSGSKIILFDFLEFLPIYHDLAGVGLHPAVGPVLPVGVQDLSAHSLGIVAILLLVPLVANIGRLVPFGWLGSHRFRKDPAAWYMAGFVVAGWIVYLVLAHPAYSQAYFLRLANPMASVFGVWVLAAAVPTTVRSGRRVAMALAGGALIGGCVVAFAHAGSPSLVGHANDLAAVVVSILVPIGLVCVALAVGVLAWVLARRRVPGLRGWGTVLVLAAFVVGGPAEGVLHDYYRDRLALAASASNKAAPKPLLRSDILIPPSAAVVMAWVNAHIPNDAVVATNRHCVYGRERRDCSSVAFWVSGLGGRRTVLEGWGYTSAAKALTDPTPFPERLAVNDAVFTRPSAATIYRLRREYGASWLVADRSAGPVSSKLAQFAVPKFSRGAVTVYELR